MGETSLDGHKMDIKECDMDESQQVICVDIIKTAQKLYEVDKDVAAFVKEELDKRFGPTWHVIVGKSFGSRVSYEMSNFLLVKCNRVNVMIFKCGY